uniref:Cytochrome P450 4F12 n=1 Tax=Anthurium amnicola TaxID=1678845 RepID=A0A1D1Z8L8_9ARAE
MFDLSNLISFFILGVIGWFTYKVYIFPYYVSPLRKIPGPPSENLFYGNVKTLCVEESGEPHIRWVKKYGNVTKYYGLFNRPIVIVADTKIIQEIISNRVYDFVKPTHLMASLIAVLGKGLVFVEGDTHKRQRKMMNPAFSHNNIKDMVPVFVRVALSLKGIIEDKIDERESKLNLTPYISKATLDIIGLVGFNYGFNSLKSQNELGEAYDSIMNIPITFMDIVISILSNYIPFVRKIPIAVNRRFNNAIEVIERVSKKLIEERHHEAKDDNNLNRNDLLSLLININKTLPDEEKMTDDELKYQIMTFLAAGHDTTSTATSWALYLLAQHPLEQDLLREELVKAFPDKSNFNPTFDEVNSLEFLNCVVKETLRLYPAATSVRRVNIKDEIFGEYLIPKGTEISIGVLALHRSPEIWGPTVENYDPNRWLDPSLTKNVTNFNYLPFLNGPKNCIGNKVALAEMKVVLSTLVRNFVFRPIEGFSIRKKAFPAARPDPCLKLDVSLVES